MDVKLELLLFGILEVIIMALLAVGTPMPIMQSYDNSVQFTMWEKRLIFNAQTTRFPLTEIHDCDFTKEKLQAMAAFALLAIAFLLIGIVFTILDVLHRPTHKWGTEVFGVIVWVFTLFVWVIGIATFRMPMCGGSGFVPYDSEWKLGIGWILFVTSWACLTLALPAMFVIKVHVRPTYWSTEETPVEGVEVDMVEGTALRRRKSKRSFKQQANTKYVNEGERVP